MITLRQLTKYLIWAIHKQVIWMTFIKRVVLKVRWNKVELLSKWKEGWARVIRSKPKRKLLQMLKQNKIMIIIIHPKVMRGSPSGRIHWIARKESKVIMKGRNKIMPTILKKMLNSKMSNTMYLYLVIFNL